MLKIIAVLGILIACLAPLEFGWLFLLVAILACIADLRREKT